MLLKYIFYSSILIIWSEALRYRVVIDLKFFYVVILINFIILFFYNKIVFHKIFLLTILYFVITGLINVLLGNVKTVFLMYQLFGVFIIATYYYSFFKLFQDQLNEIKKVYLNSAYVVVIVGYVIYILEFIVFKNFTRFHSFMLEPAHYTMVMAPALYYYFKEAIYHRKDILKFTLILLTFILSNSLVGYVAILATIIFTMNKKKMLRIAFIFSIVCYLLVTQGYKKNKAIRMRVNDTLTAINVFSTNSIEKVNLSSFAIIVNSYVAYKSFLSNPVIGNGLGSHELSHSHFLQELNIDKVFYRFGTFESNKRDANSLFLRIISEAGIIGLMLLFYFLYHFRSTETANESKISNMILMYFILKLLREGHYFSPEMYFFVMWYVYNFYSYKGNLLIKELRGQ